MASETRKIVRIIATDIDGTTPVGRGLRKIKGISFMFANALCSFTGISRTRKLVDLSAEELKKIEAAAKSPEFGAWLLNRRKDVETGRDIHAVGTNLDLYKREDINFLRRTRTYRGIRHELGLPVRGQRTRSSFRTQKTVGVAKKKIVAAAKPAAAPKPAAPEKK